MKKLFLLLACASIVKSQITWTKSTVTLSPPYFNQWLIPRYDSNAQKTLFWVTDDNGGSFNIYSDSLWSFQAATNTLTKIGTNNQSPTGPCVGDTSTWPGTRHPVEQFMWDSRRSKMIALEGVCAGVVYQDMYSIASGASTWVQLSPATFPAHGVNLFSLASMVYDNNDDVYLLVGFTASGAGQNHWAYCPTDLNPTPGTNTSNQSAICGSTADNWVELVATGIGGTICNNDFTKCPEGMWMAANAWDDVNKRIIHYGGFDSSGSTWHDETWSFDPKAGGSQTGAWTEQNTGATGPTAPNNGLPTWDGQVPFVYIGGGKMLLHRGDTTSHDWQYTYSNNTWTDLGANGGPTGGLSAAFDTLNQAMIVWTYNAGNPEIWIGSLPLVSGQFRILGTWPSGNVKWLQVDGELTSLAAGATATVTLNGSGLNIPFTVREALCASGSPSTCNSSGVARTNEPFTVGIPIPDSAGLTSISSLSLSGTASVHSGNLATDTGSTIVVSTGTATFTLNKANHNGIDIAQVGATTVLATGASQGWVITGPSPTATFPANVTCLPTSGGSTCNVPYQSNNDSSSTCSIDTINSVADNGPVRATVKCTWTYTDNASHAYMHGTARYTFLANKSYVKVVRELRNADFGTSNTFASAYKGIVSEELKITPNISGTLNFQVAADSASCSFGICSGTLNTGTDSMTLYQAQTTAQQWSADCGSPCVNSYTTDVGYSIKKNATTLASDTGGTLTVGGWAVISNSSNVGVEIGVQQFSPNWPKSLEFNNGTDVRIGLWPRESSVPYYISWPQYDVQTMWMEFFTSLPSSPKNDFLSFQHPLVGYAAVAQYNTSSVFPYKLPTQAQEDGYYQGISSGGSGAATPANPSIASGNVCCISDITPVTYRFYYWPNGGGSNQTEFRWSDLQTLLKRGMTGRYLNSVSFYNMEVARTFPRADGFTWRSHEGAGLLDSQGFPTNVTSTNGSIGYGFSPATGGTDFVQFEHEHWYGIIDYYFMTGDETIHDMILDGPVNYFLDSVTAINQGFDFNIRAVGAHMLGAARLALFLNATGDTTDGGNVLAQGALTYRYQMKPQLCLSGFPASCSTTSLTGTANTAGTAVTFTSGTTNTMMIDAPLQIGPTSYPVASITDSTHLTLATSAGTQTGATWNFTTQGTSFTRGLPWEGGQDNQCTGGPLQRAIHVFMTGILEAGLWELRQAEGSSWSEYWNILDYAYGVTQWALAEGYGTDGTTVWTNNGFRYNVQLDIANNCSAAEYAPQANQTVWLNFWIQYQEVGGVAWQISFNEALEQLFASLGQSASDAGAYTVGSIIWIINSGSSALLQPLSPSVVENAGCASGVGNYCVSWVTPSGTSNLRVKYSSTGTIVNFIGFNATTNAFVGSPSTTTNWFAATNATGIPAPVTGPQSMAINVGTTGLTAANFSVKAFALPIPPPTDGGVFSGGVFSGVVH